MSRSSVQTQVKQQPLLLSAHTESQIRGPSRSSSVLRLTRRLSTRRSFSDNPRTLGEFCSKIGEDASTTEGLWTLSPEKLLLATAMVSNHNTSQSRLAARSSSEDSVQPLPRQASQAEIPQNIVVDLENGSTPVASSHAPALATQSVASEHTQGVTSDETPSDPQEQTRTDSPQGTEREQVKQSSSRGGPLRTAGAMQATITTVSETPTDMSAEFDHASRSSDESAYTDVTATATVANLPALQQRVSTAPIRRNSSHR